MGLSPRPASTLSRGHPFDRLRLLGDQRRQVSPLPLPAEEGSTHPWLDFNHHSHLWC